MVMSPLVLVRTGNRSRESREEPVDACPSFKSREQLIWVGQCVIVDRQ